MSMPRTFDIISGESISLHTGQTWFIENQLNLPIVVKNTDMAELATTIVFVFRAAIDLTQVFGKKGKPDKARSLAEDQKAIYEQLAASLSAVGVDGRICLLRFICEAQHTRIQKLNLLGKMLATFLTPKEDNFLEEYNKASALGKAGECGGNFDSCPISLFNIFNYSKNGKLSKNKMDFEKKKVYHKKP
ncbi:uncharacterized protein LOC135212348 [Macrobrachium nipponense]|uniref:uncharacterized protein LOC135212348 n=1 Tax=Macrobrachium nipponense TaxID=159736 RepID=UPI0030C8B607